MAELIDENNITRYLTAFADGELDPDYTSAVVQYIAVNPDAARRVVGQQQLRAAAQRTVKMNAPKAPESLRQKILKLAEANPIAFVAPPSGDQAVAGGDDPIDPPSNSTPRPGSPDGLL